MSMHPAVTRRPANSAPGTYPGWPANRDPSDLVLSDHDMLLLANQHAGSVPARVEMRWDITDDETGTRALRAEGRRRLGAHGDRLGFTVVAEHWDFEGGGRDTPGVLQCVARVLWWPPAGEPASRRVLDDRVVLAVA